MSGPSKESFEGMFENYVSQDDKWTKFRAQYPNGTRLSGEIGNIVDYGVFISFEDGLTGLIHKSELSWDSKSIELPNKYKMGDCIDVILLDVDIKKHRISLSRKALLNNPFDIFRQTHKTGDIIQGKVNNIVDYGVFIGFKGGAEGLVHNSELSWGAKKRGASDKFRIGDNIEVVLLDIDIKRQHITASHKAFLNNPWEDFFNSHETGDTIHGQVSNILDYGIFVRFKDGLEGLVHISELPWKAKLIEFSNKYQIGDDIDVVLLDLDLERSRISLTLKPLLNDPYEDFSNTHKIGDIIQGQINSIVDFGIFIGLNGGIEGLIHRSNISWGSSGDEELLYFKQGDTLGLKILGIDLDENRISLSLKDLKPNPNQLSSNVSKESLISVEEALLDIPFIKINISYKTTSVSFVEGGIIKPIEFDRKKEIPTALFFESKSKVVFGVSAEKFGMDRPEFLINNFMDDLGSPIKYFFKFEKESKKLFITPKKSFKIFFRYLKNISQDYIGKNIVKTVLAVPDSYSKVQMNLLESAGQEIGFVKVEVIKESLAFLNLDFNKKPIVDDGEYVLTYKLGSSNSIATLFRKTPTHYVEIGVRKSTNIGGKIITKALSSIVYDVLEETTQLNMFTVEESNLSEFEYRKNEELIFNAAEKAKICLTNDLSTNISIPLLNHPTKEPVNISFDMNRDEFDDEIVEIRSQSINILKNLMSDFNLNAKDIKRIVMLGGTSNILSFQKSIKDTFGIIPEISCDTTAE